jgi:outer membrane protein assembly factor BamB
MVYFLSYDGGLYAAAEDSGTIKWRFATSAERRFEAKGNHGLSPSEQMIADPMDTYLSSPAVANGRVYFGSGDGHVYAIDAATGARKWDYSTSQSWVNGTPAVRDGVVYVGTSDTHRFHALDAKSGRLLWVFDAKALIFGSAALACNLAYVGAFNGKLFAIDTSTGKLAWEFQTEASKNDPLKVLDAEGHIDRSAYKKMFNNFLDMTI